MVYHGILPWLSMFQNTMVFTMDYDSIISKGLKPSRVRWVVGGSSS